MTENLLKALPPAAREEVFETLLATDAFTLERIVSTGQATPPGNWLVQNRDEWVLVVSGEAGLLLEGEPGTRTLQPGDHFLIPAGKRHRVEWTAAGRATVWLALHFDRTTACSP